jgi:hypothetical protein
MINFVAYDSYTANQVAIEAEYDMRMKNHDGNFAIGGLSLINNFYKSSTGIAETGLNSRVSIFPNPADDVVNIEITNLSQDMKVEIMNTEGRTVKASTFADGTGRIDIGNLAPGVYFVKIVVEEQGQVIQKLVIN